MTASNTFAPGASVAFGRAVESLGEGVWTFCKHGDAAKGRRERRPLSLEITPLARASYSLRPVHRERQPLRVFGTFPGPIPKIHIPSVEGNSFEQTIRNTVRPHRDACTKCLTQRLCRGHRPADQRPKLRLRKASAPAATVDLLFLAPSLDFGKHLAHRPNCVAIDRLEMSDVVRVASESHFAMEAKSLCVVAPSFQHVMNGP